MYEDLRQHCYRNRVFRRQFVVTWLSAASRSRCSTVTAQTITTDATGLRSRRSQDTGCTTEKFTAYRAIPASGGPFPVFPRGPGDLGVHEHIKTSAAGSPNWASWERRRSYMPGREMSLQIANIN